MLINRWLSRMIVVLLSAAALLVVASPVQAAPAAPFEYEIVQPDGTTFTARAWGDEWLNGVETVQGYTILQDGDGWWVYALPAEDGSLGAAGLQGTGRLVVGEAVPADLPLHVRPQGDFVPADALPGGQINTGNTGTQPTLVLLASFSDRAGTNPASNFATSIFGASNSVKDFYLDASFGQLTLAPAAETNGTANDGVIGWLNLGYNHPNTGGSTNTNNQLIVKNALIAADQYINYATYDTNGDGTIAINELHIIVVVAGYERSYNTTTPNIWAHRWSLNDVGAPSLDGKILGAYPKGGYAQFGEIHGDHQATIGIMAHELGHDLTWPDLYDVDGGAEGVGEWSIMGSGSWNATSGYPGSMPALPDAWLKWYQGWITPTAVNGTVSTSIPKADSSPTAYLLRPNPGGVDWNFGVKSGSGEYFLVENRQVSGSGYDTGLPGCGLLIWHVDESVTYTNSANANETHPLLKLMQADGLNHLENEDNRGDGGDPFPGTAGRTSFNIGTNPNSKLYSGADSGVAASNIGACGASMNATLIYPTGVFNNVYLPVITKPTAPGVRNGTFESGQDGNWSESSTGGWPLITTGLPGSITPHSGSWAAWLGGANSETARLIQNNVALGSLRYLHYWYRIDSEDICNWDFASVLVNGVVKKSYNLCTTSNTSGWVQDVIDLNAYAGTNISLEFKTTSDSSGLSSFFLDDVSITSSATMSAPTSSAPWVDWSGAAKER